jgi:undecaprenyl-diphosphatase
MIVDYLMILLAKYLYLLIIFTSLIYFFREVNENKKKIILLTIFSFPLILILAKISGKIFFDPRPFVVNHFIPLITHAADNGFPSDHSLISFAFSSAIFVFNKRVGYVLFILGALVGISRVYVGVHSPIDIFGSFIISSVIVFVLNTLFKKYNIYSRFLKVNSLKAEHDSSSA